MSWMNPFHAATDISPQYSGEIRAYFARPNNPRWIEPATLRYKKTKLPTNSMNAAR